MTDAITKVAITKVEVPQLGVNDEFVVVIEYLFEEGDKVEREDQLLTVESSKTTIDITSEVSGYFKPARQIEDEVAVGDCLGYIFQSKAELESFIIEAQPEQKDHPNMDPQNKDHQNKDNRQSGGKQNQTAQITKKAEALISQQSINVADIVYSGNILREKDVLHHLSLTTTEITFIQKKELSIPVIVYGCGRGARVINETLSLSTKYEVVGFIADRPKYDNTIAGLPVLSSPNYSLLKDNNIQHIALAITNSVQRLDCFNELVRNEFQIINVIHPKSLISPSVSLGKGNHIKAGALIDSFTTIGNACIIDNGVIIPHDNEVKDGVHLAPNATLGSSVSIGKCTIVGIGANISTQIEIGEYSIISVGSSVTRNVPPYSIVEGVPGKVIGQRKKEK